MLDTIKLKFGTMGRLLGYLWQNKMWWMIPMVIILAVFFGLMIFAQSSPLGPLIYTIF